MGWYSLIPHTISDMQGDYDPMVVNQLRVRCWGVLHESRKSYEIGSSCVTPLVNQSLEFHEMTSVVEAIKGVQNLFRVLIAAAHHKTTRQVYSILMES